MGGQMQQRNASATSLYDQSADGGSHHNAGSANDAGDAVMARWLQSAGLQHLASPVASNGIDQRLLPNLLMQVFSDFFNIEFDQRLLPNPLIYLFLSFPHFLPFFQTYDL